MQRMSTTRLMIEESIRGGLADASSFWLDEIWAFAVETNHSGWRRLVEAEWRRRGITSGIFLKD
jgi:hypothetical protein